MNAFEEAYSRLNPDQKQAVDITDGPLLVVAGPGTGKTQLLSARVANILRRTDTPAQNILCLTFTENGAANMRQRLTRFIGQAAYDVNIGTYHAFGSDLIGRYPEYFAEARIQSAVDELGKRQIVQEIVEAMRFDNPLKQTRHHLGDLMSTISEVKRALLTSKDLEAIAEENVWFIHDGSRAVADIYAGFTKMPGTLAKARPYFEQTLASLQQLQPSKPVSPRYEPLAVLSSHELHQALAKADASGKTTQLTKWKNTWLAKDADNRFIIAGELENRRIRALADVLDNYQAALEALGLYDFDDMILRSISALEKHADLRYTLQERYLYILLDEFQDTNAAQLKLISLLTDNPVHEGRPNVLAVGDDDQAIYAFQGAEYSNMLQYHAMFRDTKVINLTENYRSHADILFTAHNIAAQIESRLEDSLTGSKKTLHAANNTVNDSIIERQEFQSDIAERAWIADRIKQLVDQGMNPSEIAVLAPKHKQLEPLVAYLNLRGIPVRYEKRENILEAPVVRQLTTMCRLLLALSARNQAMANALWPEVLSYDFWQIPVETIWRLSWQARDSKHAKDEQSSPGGWSSALLDNNDPAVRRAANVLLTAANHLATESCETILDYLIGSSALDTHAGAAVISPLREFYTSPEVQKLHPERFYETMSHLTVLRCRLREYQDRADSVLMLDDLISFIDMYEAADQPMIDTSPYSQQTDAVNLLTVFKAKGLEYEHVFLPQCLDTVWGSSTRGNSNKLTLPPNLRPIRHAGATDDERLRILYVAITRAKSGLHLTSPAHTFSGSATKRLKYFDEQEQPNGSFVDKVLPPEHWQVVSNDTEGLAPDLLEEDWHTRHFGSLKDVSLKSLLRDRIEDYQLSPTSLVRFIDLEYAGPQQFFFDDILKFPHTPSTDSQFGTAIHESLEWYQRQLTATGHAPTSDAVKLYFTGRIQSKKLTPQRTELEIERGHHALTAFLSERAHIYKPEDVAEKSFHSESVFVGDAHMSGRIDRMEVDKKSHEIAVVDYKTGKSYNSWKNEMSLHKYKLQLYAYKLLIENSRTYAGYNVPRGRLEFIEPDTSGRLESLELTFEAQELERTRLLLGAVWKHVKALDFPSTEGYPVSVTGMKQYVQDLIDGTI